MTVSRKSKTFVPESVLKKRTRNSKLAEARKRFIQNRTKLAQTRKEEYTKRGEAHYKKYQEEQTQLVTLRRKVL